MGVTAGGRRPFPGLGLLVCVGVSIVGIPAGGVKDLRPLRGGLGAVLDSTSRNPGIAITNKTNIEPGKAGFSSGGLRVENRELPAG
jgi:hypothetical protein